MSQLIKIVIVAVVASCSGTPTQPRFDTRIHGGVDAPENFARHMVALINNDRPFCGGNIVSSWHVLTAAHCITHLVHNGTLISTFYGRAGSLQWASGGTIVNFANQHIHPEYNSATLKNDIGILVVDKKFEWTESIGMIGLDYQWIEEESCYVTGWGRTGPKITDISVNLSPTPDNLQLIFLETIPSLQCVEDMRKAMENNPNVLEVIDVYPPLEICTFHSHGHGMCHGDSGSGLVSLVSGLLIGVVSWGMPCAVGAPDIFVRPNGTADFIESIISV